MKTVLEISVQEAQEQLSQKNPQPTLLDVRENMEVAVYRINGATHIPLHELEDALEKLPKKTPTRLLPPRPQKPPRRKLPKQQRICCHKHNGRH